MSMSRMYPVCGLRLGPSSLYALVPSIRISSHSARPVGVTFGMIELDFLDSDQRDPHAHLATYRP